MVVQIRNSHNYLADFDSEEPLYKKSMILVEQLSSWKPSPSSASSLPARMEDLWIFLFERGYIALKDVELVQAWLVSLIAAGYVFPKPSTEAMKSAASAPLSKAEQQQLTQHSVGPSPIRNRQHSNHSAPKGPKITRLK
jgi:hypothetical protein